MTNRPTIHVSGSQGSGVSSVARIISQLELADLIVEVPHNRRVTVVDCQLPDDDSPSTQSRFDLAQVAIGGAVIGFAVGCSLAAVL